MRALLLLILITFPLPASATEWIATKLRGPVEQLDEGSRILPARGDTVSDEIRRRRQASQGRNRTTLLTGADQSVPRPQKTSKKRLATYPDRPCCRDSDGKSLHRIF